MQSEPLPVHMPGLALVRDFPLEASQISEFKKFNVSAMLAALAITVLRCVVLSGWLGAG